MGEWKSFPRLITRLHSTYNQITHLPYLMDRNKILIPNSKNSRLKTVFSLCASDYPGDLLSYIFITFRDYCSISPWSSDIQLQLLHHCVPLRTVSGHRVCSLQSKPRKRLRAGGVKPIKLTSQPPFSPFGWRKEKEEEEEERPEYSTSVLP